MRTCFCLAVVLWVIPLAAWSQPAEAPKAPEKLQIGAVAGLPRPEGFVVQDLRSPEMKTGTPLKQTYKAPMQMPFPAPAGAASEVRARHRATKSSAFRRSSCWLKSWSSGMETSSPASAWSCMSSVTSWSRWSTSRRA